MDKQSVLPPVRISNIQPPARSFFPSKSVNPEKKQTDETINKLFLSISEGNYLKVKDFILSNQITLSHRNESGESVLHIIIKNSNLTKKEKLDLVKLGLQYGASPMACDSANISVLHYACKFQLYDIVRILLEFRANPKAIDSSGKSPLHYAITGENIQCPSQSKDKVSDIIPTSSIKKKINVDEIKNLYSAVSDYLYNQIDTIKYISQIKVCLNNFHKMYPFDIKTLSDKIKNDVSDIFINGKANEITNDGIFTKVTNSKQAIVEFITQQMNDAIMPLNIKPNTTDGWGPDDNEHNKILEYRDVVKLSKYVEITIRKEKTESITLLMATLGNLDSEEKKISKFLSIINNVIDYSHYYAKIFGDMLGIPTLINLDELRPYLFNDPSKILYYPNIDKNYEYNRLTKRVTTNDGTVVPDIQITNANPRNPERIRMSTDDINAHNNSSNVKLRGIQFTSEVPLLLGNVTIGSPGLGGVLNLNYISNGAIVGSEGIYFHTEARFYSILLKKEIILLNKLVSDLINDFESNVFMKTYAFHIPRILMTTLNIILIIYSLQFTVSTLNKFLSGLKGFFGDLTMKLPDGLKFFGKQIMDDLSLQTDQMHNMLDNAYMITRKLIETTNRIISSIELTSAGFCISAYYDIDFDAYYVNDKTKQIEKGIMKPIQKVKSLPPTLAEFLRLYSNENIYVIKKALIEEYFVQITQFNPVTFISTTALAKPQIGFIGGASIYNPIYVTNIREPTRPVLPIVLRETNLAGTADIDPPHVSLIGHVGFFTSTTFDKDKQLPLTIGKFIGTHLLMLKYSIVRWIIKNVHEFMTTASVPIPNEVKLKKSLVDIINFVKAQTEFDTSANSFIYVLVGKYVDEILSNFIKNLIINQSNKIILDILEQQNIPNHFTKIFSDIMRPADGNIIMPNLDNGFSLHLNEIFDQIMGLYENPKLLRRKHIMAMSSGKLLEDLEPVTGIQKIINFNMGINSLEQLCYKIDHNIIKLLIQNKANINEKDNLGNSVLFYAIEMQNIELIRLLLSHGALVSTNKSKNRMGITPLMHAWNTYSKMINVTMTNKNTICDDITKNNIELFRKKVQNNNIPKYTKILLPLSLHLLNYQIYVLGKEYCGNWTYELNDQLESILNIKTKSVLPLLEMQMSDSDIPQFDVSNTKINILKTNVDTNNQFLNQLNRQYQNLQKEFNELSKIGTPTNEQVHRQNEITDMLTDIMTEQASINTKITSYNNHINTLGNAKMNAYTRLKNYIDKNKMHLKRTGSAVDNYESVFNDVINHDFHRMLKEKKYDFNIDFKTYPVLWNKYFTNVPSNDWTQIVDLIYSHQKNILLSIDDINSKNHEINLIYQYYANIINPFIKNYTELPKEYNATNYGMTIIMDIIIHIVKRVIFPVMFSSLIKVIIKYVLTSQPKTDKVNKQTDYNSYIAKIITKIINDHGNHNTSRIMAYIFNDLPTKVVKSILQIYEGPNEGEDDVDRTITIQNMFLQINKILMTTTVIDISESSSLITNLEKYLYPYYIDYLTLFCKEMKSLIDNYLRSLQHQVIEIEILHLLLSKASAEV